MTRLLEELFQEQCTHTPETPCARLIECLDNGPLCHDHPEASIARRERFARLSRRELDHPAIFVGAGTCGLGAGAQKTLEAIERHVSDADIKAEVIETGCIGLCAVEPLVDIKLPGQARLCFGPVTEKEVDHLLDTVMANQVPEELVIGQFRETGAESWPNVPFLDEHPFFAQQERLVLSRCGLIDPASIEEAFAAGAYRGLARALHTMTPAELCGVVEESGLRGRGGGGFPTGRKWRFALDTPADQRYFICNADEGDPGAFMDRAIIEGDPHRLLEGLAVGAYAIGATKAYVYIRAEYPLAIERLERAIKEAKSWGLLGDNVLDSGFRLDIIIKRGAGAFVCGEETALIHSIEGRRGMPRPRPPFPAVSGLFGKPTVINNVETLANLPEIVERGAEFFAATGTETSKGTKVFAISGKVRRTGLVEVAMGTKVRDIIFDIGGGPEEGRTFKAVQIGGPSGGCLKDEHLDIPIDYESLKTVGAMMGSGGLVVMDDKTCMVDVAKFFMDFIQRESCGKCIPCREGTRRMLETLERVTHGHRSETGNDGLRRFKGVMGIEQLAESIRITSLCGLGQTAPNPVLSTLRNFRDEYEAHVYERHCPAGVCTELLTYTIDPEICNGCTLCAKKCPSDAIVGARKAPHAVVEDKCIGCGACVNVCRFGAVTAA